MLLTDPRVSGGVFRRLHPHRPVHLCHRLGPRQAGAGSWRCQEPHAGDAGCGSRSGGFRPDGAAYGAAGERRMAIRWPWWSAMTADALVVKPRPWWRPCGSAPAWARVRRTRWGPISREHLAKVRAATWIRRGRVGRAGGRWSRCQPWGGLLLSAAACSTGSAPRCASTGRRSFGPVSPRAGAGLRDGPAPHQRTRVRQRHRHLHRRRGYRARDFTTRVQVGMVGERSHPLRPWRLHSFRWLETVHLGPSTCTGRMGYASHPDEDGDRLLAPEPARAGAEFFHADNEMSNRLAAMAFTWPRRPPVHGALLPRSNR